MQTATLQLNRATFVEAATRVLFGSLDFEGRARRFDGAAWMAVSLFMVFPTTILLSFASLPEGREDLMMDIVAHLYPLPLIAWFVRRVQDQNWPSWMGAMMPLMIITDFWRPMVGHPVFSALATLFLVATIFLALLPGDEGRNYYGPNPR